MKLSLIFNLTPNPKNIKMNSPKDDKINKEGIHKPTISPTPPHISKLPTSLQNFSKPNLLNSNFIASEKKMELPYMRKDTAENPISILLNTSNFK